MVVHFYFLIDNYDKLAQKYHPDIIEKAVNTMCSHAESLLHGDIEKLVKSHSVIQNQQDHRSAEIDDAGLCIDFGMCE